MKFKKEIIELTEGISFSMIYVPKGKFLFKNEDLVEVNAFWMGQYLVSQELYEEISKENPAEFRGKHLPIENISWYDAILFCNALSTMLGYKEVYQIEQSDLHNPFKWKVSQRRENGGFRLPIKKEWEYAASGATEKYITKFSGSKKLEKVGWYGANLGLGKNESQELGLKAPNEFGLYDMSGNVWERLWDWGSGFDSNDADNSSDYLKKNGHYRLLHGGSWKENWTACRLSYSLWDRPGTGRNNIGLRLVRTFS